MISKNIKTAIRNAISSDNAAARKWVEVGKACATEYANRTLLPQLTRPGRGADY